MTSVTTQSHAWMMVVMVSGKAGLNEREVPGKVVMRGALNAWRNGGQTAARRRVLCGSSS